MNSKQFLLSLGLFLSAFVGVNFGQQAQPASAVDLDYQVAAILYQQKAAEYRALAYQAFNLARWQLDADFQRKNLRALPKAERSRPRAIVVDIDETVLDNSPANAYSVKNKVAFNLKDWYAWGDMRKAKAVPGSVDFINYAVSKGVKIFYISNRDEVQKQATLDNLKSAGFSDISADNVFLRTEGSGKEPRRKTVSDRYRIVFLMGDNLDDFSDAFERRSVAERFAETDRNRFLWGKKFIVLPNAMYGTWESAIYEYGRLTESEKARIRANALELP
jgi:5'-nucleotidase (lipoprotein e(P4) family)